MHIVPAPPPGCHDQPAARAPVPAAILNALERLNLLDGLLDVEPTPDGYALHLAGRSALAVALRPWGGAADAFAIAIGRAGFFIDTSASPVEIHKSRGPNHD